MLIHRRPHEKNRQNRENVEEVDIFRESDEYYFFQILKCRPSLAPRSGNIIASTMLFLFICLMVSFLLSGKVNYYQIAEPYFPEIFRDIVNENYFSILERQNEWSATLYVNYISAASIVLFLHVPVYIYFFSRKTVRSLSVGREKMEISSTKMLGAIVMYIALYSLFFLNRYYFGTGASLSNHGLHIYLIHFVLGAYGLAHISYYTYILLIRLAAR